MVAQSELATLEGRPDQIGGRSALLGRDEHDRAIARDERRARPLALARAGTARGDEQGRGQHGDQASHISMVTCRGASGTPTLGAGQEIGRGLGIHDRSKAVAFEFE